MSRAVECDNCKWGGHDDALLAGDACPNCASTTALRAVCVECGEPDAMFPRLRCDECTTSREPGAISGHGFGERKVDRAV